MSKITVTFDSKDDSYVVEKKGKSKLTLQEIQDAVTERCGADELIFVVIRTGYTAADKQQKGAKGYAK